MGLLERFNERFPAASSKGKDAIAWVRDSCETLADAYDAKRELNAIKKDPVEYYRNMVRANAENIANVDISKIPHSVYKELAIIAVLKNPNFHFPAQLRFSVTVLGGVWHIPLHRSAELLQYLPKPCNVFR